MINRDGLACQLPPGLRQEGSEQAARNFESGIAESQLLVLTLGAHSKAHSELSGVIGGKPRRHGT